MELHRRSTSISVIGLSIILLFLFTYNLNVALASSGGVMGGSFFDSDSESSSSESYTSDSEPIMVKHDNDVSSSNTEVARESHGGGPMIFFIFISGLLLVGFFKNTNGNLVTVFKLQVAMLGAEMGSSIQKDLIRIAKAADTSSRKGVSYLLTETIQSLDQHHGYCIAGYSSVCLKQSKEDGEKCYNQLSNEERAKFDEETLVNLNDTKKKSTSNQCANVVSIENSMFDVKESKEKRNKIEEEKLLNEFGNKYIVITILVAAKGADKLPNIIGTEDLKKALQKLKSLLSSKLLAGEVLWTPQNEDDTLSKQKLLEDYSELAMSMKSFTVKKHE